eukprot:Gb_20074 [translate_table: standard]
MAANCARVFLQSLNNADAAIGVASMLLILVWIWMKGTKKNTKHLLPPGPYSWPIIGNLHLLLSLPHRALQELAKKYGDIMYLRLGSVPTVVVSSPEMAKEFLKSRDLIFASRPASAAGKYMTYNSMDVALAPYGPNWRHLRKISTMELLSAKRFDSFKDVREQEVCKMMQSIWKESVNGTIPVNMRKHFKSLTSNVMCSMLVGTTYTDADSTGKRFKTMVDEILTLNGAVNIADFIPCLEWADLQGMRRRMKNVHRAFDEFAEEIIDQHIERSRKPDQCGSSGHHKDFVDVLLDMESGITRENIKAIILTLRLHPTGPLLLPHESTEACTVGGYHIPSKTRLMVNVWAIGRDPSVWEEPLEFKPERFMGSSIDVKGHDFELLPFGTGRRGCPGTSFSLRVIHLAFAHLSHHFEWTLPPHHDSLDMSEVFGLPTRPRLPLFATPNLPSACNTMPNALI